MNRKIINRFLEFLIVGVFLGVAEDLIAISLATGKSIDGKIFLIAFLASFPFAVFSELIVDHDKFKELMKKWFKKI